MASSVFVSETELSVLLLLLPLSRNDEMEDESIEEEDVKRKRRQYSKLDIMIT